MTTWLKKNWLIVLLMVLPALAGLAVWNQLPDELPTHWNARGEVDDTMPKEIAIFLMSGTMLFTNVIFWVIPFLDPKKNLEASKTPIHIIQLSTNALLCFLGLLMLGAGLGYDVNIATLVPVGVLFLFVILGNYMGKMRPNYFVGIRTPWTLESEEVWRKTHKLAGWIWVGMSLGLIGLALLIKPEVFFIVFLVGVGIMVLIPVTYSYLAFRQEKQ